MGEGPGEELGSWESWAAGGWELVLELVQVQVLELEQVLEQGVLLTNVWDHMG